VTRLADLYIQIHLRGPGGVGLSGLFAQFNQLHQQLTMIQQNFTSISNVIANTYVTQINLAAQKTEEFNKQLKDLDKDHFKVLGPTPQQLGRLAGAASPAAMDTLMGSFQLLAAVVGTTLIPTVLNLALAVQRAAFWFDKLSPETKDLVGSLAVPLALTAGGAALGGRFGPIGAALGAAPGAFLTGQTLLDKLGIGEGFKDLDLEGVRAGMGAQEIMSDADVRRILGLPKDQQIKETTRRLGEVRKQELAAISEAEPSKDIFAIRQILQPASSLVSEFFTGNQAKVAGRARALAGKSFALQSLQDLLVEGKELPEKKNPFAELLKNFGMMGAMGQARFVGIEELGQEVQMAALSPNTLLQEIINVQLKNLAELQGIHTDLPLLSRNQIVKDVGGPGF
jgi:hypothetical protein